MKSILLSRTFQMVLLAIVAVALFHTGHADVAASLAFIGATLPSKAGAVTLVDFANSIDPDGRVAKVAELLSQSNEILTDMQWIEGNLPTGHRASVRTGLPTAIWRKLYQGVPASKSVRAQVDDTVGMLETRSEVDVALADLNGNTAAFRLSEAQAFIEGMNQTFCDSLIYGDQSVNPERITGLTPRYSSLTAPNGGNIIDAGGTGSNNSSIWLVVWGSETVTGIFPKGSQAGLMHKDLGEIDAFDANNNRYRAYADWWKWTPGLHVKDWRYVVRIANINMADLVAQTGTQAPTAATAVMKLLVRAMARIPMMGMGKPVFYANRSIKEFLAIAALDKSNAALAIQPALQQFGSVAPGHLGNGTTTFLGVPVRTVDRLLSTETRVV
ncbi:major capsid protein [Variovorax sp. GT1P44]|uniref:major capsid protein n=1 Tax=Variovorax sp. GT1P44 TaxID=3443742 RepID=UPI003F456119